MGKRTATGCGATEPRRCPLALRNQSWPAHVAVAVSWRGGATAGGPTGGQGLGKVFPSAPARLQLALLGRAAERARGRDAGRATRARPGRDRARRVAYWDSRRSFATFAPSQARGPAHCRSRRAPRSQGSGRLDGGRAGSCLCSRVRRPLCRPAPGHPGVRGAVGEGAARGGRWLAAASELLALQKDVTRRMGSSEGDILGAQALVLEGPGLRDRVMRLVEERRINAEAALSDVIDAYTRTFDGVSDGYLRERAADVRDVGRRLLSTLVERQPPARLDLPESAIVVAQELLPSVTARLQLENAHAFVTERGNRYSHSAILARSHGTPAVAGVRKAFLADQDRRSAHRRWGRGVGVREPRAVDRARVRGARGRAGGLPRSELRQLVGLAVGHPRRDADPAARERQQVRGHRGRAPLRSGGYRPVPDRVRVLDPPALPHRGRAVRVPRPRRRALRRTNRRVPAAGSRRRQGPAVLPVAARAEPLPRASEACACSSGTSTC